jgi:hypothetical protein
VRIKNGNGFGRLEDGHRRAASIELRIKLLAAEILRANPGLKGVGILGGKTKTRGFMGRW